MNDYFITIFIGIQSFIGILLHFKKYGIYLLSYMYVLQIFLWSFYAYVLKK